MSRPEQLQAEADEIASRRPDSISAAGRLTLRDPKTAQDWRAIQSALLVDAEAWSTLAEQAGTQVGLPDLIGIDYGIRISRACREAQQAARDAAALAELYASELAPSDVA